MNDGSTRFCDVERVDSNMVDSLTTENSCTNGDIFADVYPYDESPLTADKVSALAEMLLSVKQQYCKP